jgi:hypothetical protein
LDKIKTILSYKGLIRDLQGACNGLELLNLTLLNFTLLNLVGENAKPNIDIMSNNENNTKIIIDKKSFEDIIKENINIENFDYEPEYIKKQLREFYLYWSEKSIN